ncbi:MAG TPA: VTT domain-containing protein [Candidatus Paceibacterota bacterium]
MDHIKNNKHIAVVVGIAILSLLAYFWFIKQTFFQNFVTWSQHYIWVYFIVLVFFKTLAIVWPPLPGGLFTLGSVAVIGWQWAFAGQVVGGLIGGSIAFFLGRKYGFWLLSKLFDDVTIEKIKKVKIYKHREFEAIFFLRIFTTTISEAISYGAGLVGIHFRNFILATLLGFVFELPLFYLASSVLRGENLFVSAAMVLVAGLLFYKLKGRYFE